MWHCLWCSPGAGTRCRSKGHIAWPTTWLHIGCTLVAHLSSFSRFIFWILFGHGQPGGPMKLEIREAATAWPSALQRPSVRCPCKSAPPSADSTVPGAKTTRRWQSQSLPSKSGNPAKKLPGGHVPCSDPVAAVKNMWAQNSFSSGNYLKQSLSECELKLWATVWTVIIGLDLGLRVWDMVVFKHGPSVLSWQA